MSIETKIKRFSKICAFVLEIVYLIMFMLNFKMMHLFILPAAMYLSSPSNTPFYATFVVSEASHYTWYFCNFDRWKGASFTVLPIIWCIDQLHRPLDKKMPHRFRALQTNSTISVYSYLNGVFSNSTYCTLLSILV